MTETVVRLLSEADVDTYWTLRLEALKNEPESFGATFEESVNTPLADVVNQLNPSEDSFVMGAFAPHLVGMVGLYRRNGLKLRHKGTIWGMYVAADGRGKGIGRALMRALIAHAVSLSSYEQLVLTVVTTNDAAHSLYLSLGFKTYGTEIAALKLGNLYLDEELMALQLILSTVV
ncbi:MAG: GNAT family N-acetyltransferase [Candidatus Obscuribacterales bacterium]|nr:GNAT family N-acetyltransferase [Candidatus Obscuribacterales bacterium]